MCEKMIWDPESGVSGTVGMKVKPFSGPIKSFRISVITLGALDMF
jgi:hypothetical protein